MQKIQLAAVIAALAVSAPVMAQGRGHGGVPLGQRPPAGMCRIWIDGVPPGHQPAPTDCATAAARVPPNARIIYGERTAVNQRDPRRDVYDQNGRVYDPRRADPTGQVIYDPRRTDPTGQVIYDPRRADPNGQVIYDPRRVDQGGYLYDPRRLDSTRQAATQRVNAKKHKGHGNDDRD